MALDKAGCILINIENKKVALVHRLRYNDYSFPKGHQEGNESLMECAIRETEEETCHLCHIVSEIGINNYSDYEGDVNVYMFLAIDDGKVSKVLNPREIEETVWVSFEEVETLLSYDNLKEFWNKVKSKIEELINKGE